MNPDEFPEALEDLIPAKPSATGWGERIRRRRRNRRAGAAAAAGVAAVAVLAAAVQFGGQSTVTATPVPADPSTPQPTITSLEPAECALPSEDEHNVAAELPDGQLPEGATAVWLCGAQSTPERHHVGAAEPLTMGVGEAVDAFNSVPSERGPAWSCALTPDLMYRVVYGYPDGTRHEAVGTVGGCEGVESGGYHRPGGLPYLEQLRALWSHQRETEDTTFSSDVPVCPERSTVMGLGLEDMTSAVVCGPVGDDPEGSLQIPLSDELAADIVAEITAEDRVAGFQPGIGRSAPSLVLLSDHGDPLSLQGTPDGYNWYPSSNEGGLHVWTPSRDLAARMWAEIGGSGQCTVPGRITPDQVPVQVYDGGGGAVAVAAVVEHLEEAGFLVTDTGESITPSLGSPVYLRGGGESRGMDLVETWVGSGSGEMSRDDNIVDVVVTDGFTVDVLKEGQPDISDGNFRCAGRETAAPSDSTSVPDPGGTTAQPGYPGSGEPTAFGLPLDLPTSQEIEEAWFDDDKLAVLPSSIRESVEFWQAGILEGGDEISDVDVSLSVAGALLKMDTQVLDGRGTLSGWSEYHRLLGGGESEEVSLPAVEICFSAGEELLTGAAPDSVPGDGLPNTPEYVALCMAGLVDARSMPAGTGMGLISWSDVEEPQQAVDLYNSLPAAGQECRTTSGDWGYIVYHYGDGSQYVLQVWDNECGSVVAGNDHRRGGDEFLADLWGLVNG